MSYCQACATRMVELTGGAYCPQCQPNGANTLNNQFALREAVRLIESLGRRSLSVFIIPLVSWDKLRKDVGL